MVIKDKVRFSLLILAIVQAIIIYFLWNKPCPPCYEAGQTVITHDTIWPINPLEPIIVKVPEAFKSVAKKSISKAVRSKTELTESVWKVDGDGHAYAELCQDISSPCDTINYYSDTTINRMPDSCMIVVNDTITDNKISGRSIWFQSRMPLIKTTITEVRKEKWKVYIGGAFTYNARELQRWGAGPEVLLTIPKIGGVNYIYDGKNNAHTIGVMALIRFKK